MRKMLLPIGVLVALAGPAAAGDLALKRVMLSTGGVGYFEYATTVDGPATLGLDVPLSQVDDVLQSLVVFDSAGGVGGVELPGADGSRAAFADVPFGPEALTSALAYLNSLQGAALEVKGPRPMTGRLLHAETVRQTVAGAAESSVAQTRVTLVSATGLQQFVLEDADSVQVADPDLRARIERVLEAVRGAAAHDARHLQLRSTGSGQREVRVGYVAGAPLWKTTYRLMLPATEGAKARLQGWAVLENDSGADWNGVDLALQYGNPVTFRQALYRSYYVDRPEVPVEVLGRILPGVDTGAHPMAAAESDGAVAKLGQRRGSYGAPSPAVPAPAAVQLAAPANEAAASERIESTVFRLASPLVLPAGHTATVPILDREVPAERVGVVQPGRPHPLQALQVKNDTATSLPAGVLTLYDPGDEATFAGDARLGGLPAGESRLLEFAEDLRTGVDWRTDQQVTILGVTAAQGVLRVQRRVRSVARVTLVAPPTAARRLLLEIPRDGQGTLTTEGAMEAATETATAWRLPVSLRAGETRTVVAYVDHTYAQEIGLMQDSGVLTQILNEQALAPAARDALRHIADLRAALAQREAERDRNKADLGEVERDEDRLRSNLAAVPATDALHGKLVRALGADEDRIDGINAGIAQAETAVTQARTALEQAVASLRI